jgi:hypothetical protein
MAERCIAFNKVDEEVFPYILFLPTEKDKLISLLNGVFGSEKKIAILQKIPACGDTKIYQKDLIETLPYSNKTVIKNLKELCDLNILHEDMEQQKGNGGAWVKYYLVDEKMTWLVLLFKEPSELDNIQQIILQLASLYYFSIVDMAKRYGLTEDDIKAQLGI